MNIGLFVLSFVVIIVLIVVLFSGLSPQTSTMVISVAVFIAMLPLRNETDLI